MKTLMIASLVLMSQVALAQSMSGNDFSGSESGEGYSTTNISGTSYYKQDIKMMVPEAILVLEGVPASDEFLAIKEALSVSEKKDLTDVEAARLIIAIAAQK